MALKIEISTLTQVTAGGSYEDAALIVRDGIAYLLPTSAMISGSYAGTLTLVCSQDNTQVIVAVEKGYDADGNPIYSFALTPKA